MGQFWNALRSAERQLERNTEMPFVEAALDVQEREVVAEGEYDLRCGNVDHTRQEDENNPRIVVIVNIEGNPDAAPIWHTLWLSNKNSDPERRADNDRANRRFMEVFNIPYEATGFNSDDIPGSVGKCLVVQQEGDDKVIRNKLRLPYLSATPQTETGKRRRA